MNKKDFVKAVVDQTGLPAQDVLKVFEAQADITAKALAEGDSEVIYGNAFKIKLKDKAERTGRNPKTGEAIVIPAKRTLATTFLKAFKDKVGI